MNIQMFKLDREKLEESGIKLSTSVGSLEVQEYSKKTLNSASLTTPKPLTVWITTNCGKFLDGNTTSHYLSPEKPVCRSRSNS